MANTLGAYNPIFFANEALIWLNKSLGMASRVHRGYEAERTTYGRSDTIRIRRPSAFTAQSAPSSAQDLKTETVNITLSQWKEVKFSISDKELAYTNDIIIREHIAPAAYALADIVDQDLAALYKDIPWLYDYGTATDHTIITGEYGVLFNNRVPMMPGKIHMMVDSTLQTYFQNSQVFHSAQVVGGTENQNTLMMGHLGTRFNVEVFANQNTPTHTPGTAAQTAGDNAGAVNGAHSAGATSLAVNGFTGTETLKAGDTFGIAGNTQRYAVTADVTFSSGAGTLTITPGLAAALSGTEVVTVTKQTDTAHSQILMFHEHAFALAMAPLPDRIPGMEVATVADPVSGLAVRARIFPDGANSALVIALDCLYGVKTLNPNLAARGWT